MKVEKQFANIKRDLESGELKEFGQLFDYVHDNWMRTYLQTGYNRITRIKTDPGGLKASEMITLAELIKVDPGKIAQIVFAQIHKNNNKKKKKNN